MSLTKPAPKAINGKTKQTGVRQTFTSSIGFDQRLQKCAAAKGYKNQSYKILFLAVEKYLSDNHF